MIASIKERMKLAIKFPILTIYWLYRRLFLFFTKPISYLLKDILFSHYYIFGWWINWKKRVKIASTAIINDAFLNVNSWNIIIKDYVFTWHWVSLITGTHDYNKFDFERIITSQPTWNDITIEKGVWIWANSSILWPCTIGEYSVVAAGAVVTKDIWDYEIWGGVPAKKIKDINH
jgi:acetyltransferase-like isoleucine patch superfamily enzyme